MKVQRTLQKGESRGRGKGGEGALWAQKMGTSQVILSRCLGYSRDAKNASTQIPNYWPRKGLLSPDMARPRRWQSGSRVGVS